MSGIRREAKKKTLNFFSSSLFFNVTSKLVIQMCHLNLKKNILYKICTTIYILGQMDYKQLGAHNT